MWLIVTVSKTSVHHQLCLLWHSWITTMTCLRNTMWHDVVTNYSVYCVWLYPQCGHSDTQSWINATRYTNTLICPHVHACGGSYPNLWMRSHLYECAGPTYPWGFPLMLRINTEQGGTRYMLAAEWMLLGRTWVKESGSSDLYGPYSTSVSFSSVL